MKWLTTKKIRRTAERVHDRLISEYGDENESWTITLALALAHACHPTSSYGDGAEMDEMIENFRALPIPPCDPDTASQFVKDWERSRMTTDEMFGRIWGKRVEPFVIWLVDHAGLKDR